MPNDTLLSIKVNPSQLGSWKHDLLELSLNRLWLDAKLVGAAPPYSDSISCTDGQAIWPKHQYLCMCIAAMEFLIVHPNPITLNFSSCAMCW